MIMKQIYSLYMDFIKNRDAQGLRRELCAVTPDIAGHIVHQGKSYIDFSSNDYLGLKHDPRISERAQSASKKYGNGSGASRAVTGNFDLYGQVEQKVARWKNKQSALIMAGGFHCNASVLPTLFDKTVLGMEPLVFTDKLIHASMHQGCTTAGVKQIRFRHNDMEHLSELLQKHADSNAPKFILTESVFSMDGDVAPLDKLYVLRDKHDACLIVDEAHATGVFGENGQGLASKADIIIGTCGKALGGFGSYVAADKVVIDYLIQNCKGFIYSTALPPSIVASIDIAIDLVSDMSKEREHVLALAEYFRNELKGRGYDCGESTTQIVPLILGGVDETMALSDSLKENGFWTTAIRPPTIPVNASRIRFAFSSVHTEGDINRLLDVLKSPDLKRAA